jgi:hypothetical protein
MAFGFGSFASAPWASLPTAPSAKVSYALTCATGSYIFVGNDATLTYVNKAPLNLYGGAGTYKGAFNSITKEPEQYDEEDDEEMIIMALAHQLIEMRVI